MDLDALALGELSRLCGRAHVEADDQRVRGRREVDVVLDPADALVDDADAHLGVLDLLQLGDRRLDRALHVALENEVRVLDGAGLQLRSCSSDGPPPRGRRQLLPPEPLTAHLRTLTRVALVLDDATELARGRRVVEPEDLDGLARLGLLDLLAAEVVERVTRPQASSAMIASPTCSVPRWTSIVATGPRPTSV